MNKNLLLAVAVPALLLLSGCGDDEPSLPSDAVDLSSLFDPLFAKELELRGYIESAANITPEDVADITWLDVSRSELKSLRGIEYFTNLQQLYCYVNQLTELDVTGNPALSSLDCSDNQLTELDVTSNPALSSLSCSSNQLTELDVTGNTALTSLYCINNQLTELDVTGNQALTGLFCRYNQLTELDVTGNKALTELYCDDNQLTELDVTGNTALTELYCSDNQLTELNVTGNIALTSLSFGNNQLTELDISNNQNLSSFRCTGNPGENGVFRVKVWSGFGEVPEGFDSGSYNYNGSTVTIEYWK